MGSVPASVWFSHSPGLSEAKTGCLNSATLSLHRFPPVCPSVRLSLSIFVSVCTQKCRLMPCRTDRLNANPWVSTKTSPRHQALCIYVCMCVSLQPDKFLPASLLYWLNTDIKQLPLVNSSKGHCRYFRLFIPRCHVLMKRKHFWP